MALSMRWQKWFTETSQIITVTGQLHQYMVRVALANNQLPSPSKTPSLSAFFFKIGFSEPANKMTPGQLLFCFWYTCLCYLEKYRQLLVNVNPGELSFSVRHAEALLDQHMPVNAILALVKNKVTGITY